MKNDMIYMYSVGYIDQFGRPKKQKFMTKNFKELLSEIYTETPSRQKELLEHQMDAWKGNFEQIDDMLVMGIKFTDIFGVVELF